MYFKHGIGLNSTDKHHLIFIIVGKSNHFNLNKGPCALAPTAKDRSHRTNLVKLTISTGAL